jgi:hypothetical protein
MATFGKLLFERLQDGPGQFILFEILLDFHDASARPQDLTSSPTSRTGEGKLAF